MLRYFLGAVHNGCALRLRIRRGVAGGSGGTVIPPEHSHLRAVRQRQRNRDRRSHQGDVPAGVIVGRIFMSPGAPQDWQWMWASGHNGQISRAAHGYESTREAAMAAFAKCWRRNEGGRASHDQFSDYH
jgi:hypothetical protein